MEGPPESKCNSLERFVSTVSPRRPARGQNRCTSQKPALAAVLLLRCWNGPSKSASAAASGRNTLAADGGEHCLLGPDDCDAGSRRPRCEGGKDVFEAAGGSTFEGDREPGSIVQATSELLLNLRKGWRDAVGRTSLEKGQTWRAFLDHLIRRRANRRQGPNRRRFRRCRLLANCPRDLHLDSFCNRRGTGAGGARRSYMLPTEEHVGNPDPIAGAIDTNLVRRPLRLCFEPPGCWRMTGNCNWPDNGYGAVPVCEWVDDTGAQIWLPAQADG